MTAATKSAQAAPPLAAVASRIVKVKSAAATVAAEAAVDAVARVYAAITNVSVSPTALESSAAVTAVEEAAVDAGSTSNAPTTNAFVQAPITGGSAVTVDHPAVDSWGYTDSPTTEEVAAAVADVRGPVGRKDPTVPTIAIGAVRLLQGAIRGVLAPRSVSHSSATCAARRAHTNSDRINRGVGLNVWHFPYEVPWSVSTVAG